MLLIAAGSLWLFLAAVPARAAGGPHVKAINSGAGTGSTLTADSCAGCHRAHTAQGSYLLAAPDEEALCLSCHGAAGTGSTVDVESGVQYTLASGERGGTVLGALRNGGFINARIDSGAPARIFETGSALNPLAKVSVASTGRPVTSSHLNLAANALAAPSVAWGNDGINGGAGPEVELSCASCHNPHGNDQYRILNPIPAPEAVTSGAFETVGAPGVRVTDAALPASGDTRNYTVIQVKGTAGVPSTFLLYASQVVSGGYASTSGDYWHVRVPWNSATGSADAPNGVPSGLTPFNTQIEAWCTSCHTRYHTESGGPIDDSGDSIFRYKHQTTGRTTCTTCHVAHGSSARMEGVNALNQPFPDESVVRYDIGGVLTGDSRLLKVDGRGTCQLCHDPTGSVTANTYSGPLPAPGVP